MSVTLAEFQAYVGTDESTFPQECLTAAQELVNKYHGSSNIPVAIHDQAVYICASELFHRRSAPNGIAQFASMDGSPVRVARDPMTAVYSLLMPYVGFGV
jgi:hypothetical protein